MTERDSGPIGCALDDRWGAVAEILERMISPGRQSRLSPFVEDLQLAVLFGERPVPGRRAESSREIIERHGSRLDRLADVRRAFVKGGMSFDATKYDSREFLDHYLIHYTSVNVAKVQLAMLDAVRAGALPADLRVLDIGVGSSTTAIAITDFVLALYDACALAGQPFPIYSFGLELVDQSSGALEYADSVLREMATQLETQRGDESDTDRAAMFGMLIEGLSGAGYHERDLADLPGSADECTLWVVSYVLAEGGVGERAYRPVAERFAAGSLPGLALILEPGDREGAARARALRGVMLAGGDEIGVLGPCATDVAHQPTCEECWLGRQEHYWRSALYEGFRRRFGDEKEGLSNNKELSWTYVLLARGAMASACPQVVAAQGEYRVMGYTRNSKSPAPVVRLCPAGSGGTSLRLNLDIGYTFPVVPYGTAVRISGVSAEAGVLRPTDPDEFSIEILRTDGNAAYVSPTLGGVDLEGALNSLARRLFGFRRLHDFQLKVVTRVLAGRSTLAIAATGGGKSECYILPAMLLPGVTVVISPLRSLMADQYDVRLRRRYGLDRVATTFNSDKSFLERETALALMEAGFYKIAYFTPEQIQQAWVMEALSRVEASVGISLVAFDEAHCINQWGHDFRPAYLNLVNRFRSYGINPTALGLTATASPVVREDICAQLHLDPRPIEEGGDLYIESSHRAELNWTTDVVSHPNDKAKRIVEELRACCSGGGVGSGSAVVFMPWAGQNENYSQTDLSSLAASPRVTEFAAYLERVLGTRVAIYHGKMEEADSPGESSAEPDRGWLTAALGDMRHRSRANQQDAFMSGEVPIMVATKGFGMGVDKSDIRVVVHRTLPGNLEAYVQEAGRAGRDGDFAMATLLHDGSMEPAADAEDQGRGKSDYDIQSYFLDAKTVRAIDVTALLMFIVSLDRHDGNRAYFTLSDYRLWLEKHGGSFGYSWPVFPERREPRSGSQDHIAILEAGDWSSAFRSHLESVLAVLHETRPTVDAREILTIGEYRECGSLTPRVGLDDARLIVGSNAYFGRTLRQQGITAEVLSDLCDGGSLYRLAAAAGLSLSDAQQLLSDARFVVGRVGKVRTRYGKGGELRDEAEQFAWLSRYGARRRMRLTDNEKARLKSLPREPQLLGWFWTYHARPVGWELELGEIPSESVARWSEAVYDLHNQRVVHRHQAFERFVRDYVMDAGACLKSVMLGYLRTNELVIGSCLCCSHCVPDGDFSTDMAERRARVARLTPEQAASVEALATAAGGAVDWAVVDDVLGLLTSEESVGARMMEFLVGLSGRLLDEDPNHAAATAFRMVGLSRGLIPGEAAEFAVLASLVERRFTHADAVEMWKRIDGAFVESPELNRLLAILARAAGDDAREAELLDLYLELGLEGLSLSEVDRLAHLHGPEGSHPDQVQWAKALGARLNRFALYEAYDYCRSAGLDTAAVRLIAAHSEVALRLAVLFEWVDRLERADSLDQDAVGTLAAEMAEPNLRSRLESDVAETAAHDRSPSLWAFRSFLAATGEPSGCDDLVKLLGSPPALDADQLDWYWETILGSGTAPNLTDDALSLFVGFAESVGTEGTAYLGSVAALIKRCGTDRQALELCLEREWSSDSLGRFTSTDGRVAAVGQLVNLIERFQAADSLAPDLIEEAARLVKDADVAVVVLGALAESGALNRSPSVWAFRSLVAANGEPSGHDDLVKLLGSPPALDADQLDWYWETILESGAAPNLTDESLSLFVGFAESAGPEGTAYLGSVGALIERCGTDRQALELCLEREWSADLLGRLTSTDWRVAAIGQLVSLIERFKAADSLAPDLIEEAAYLFKDADVAVDMLEALAEIGSTPDRSPSVWAFRSFVAATEKSGHSGDLVKLLGSPPALDTDQLAWCWETILGSGAAPNLTDEALSLFVGFAESAGPEGTAYLGSVGALIERCGTDSQALRLCLERGWSADLLGRLTPADGRVAAIGQLVSLIGRFQAADSLAPDLIEEAARLVKDADVAVVMLGALAESEEDYPNWSGLRLVLTRYVAADAEVIESFVDRVVPNLDNTQLQYVWRGLLRDQPDLAEYAFRVAEVARAVGEFADEARLLWFVADGASPAENVQRAYRRLVELYSVDGPLENYGLHREVVDRRKAARAKNLPAALRNVLTRWFG